MEKITLQTNSWRSSAFVIKEGNKTTRDADVQLSHHTWGVGGGGDKEEKLHLCKIMDTKAKSRKEFPKLMSRAGVKRYFRF